MERLILHPTHPTAEEVFQAINEGDPRASLATVYKALHALARAGLIRELVLGGPATRFEAVTERHHHFVCEACGRVEDVPWLEIPDAALQGALDGRSASSFEVILRGRCASCA